MRLRARPGLHYAQVSGGVYVSGARTQFVLRGSELLFTVADVCVPRLEGGTTEDELVAALRTERARPAVRHLVDNLRAHGMLLDLDLLTIPEPAQQHRDRYADSLAFLETVCADPYAVFARLRATTVLLAGPDPVVVPAARGLSAAGVGRVTVVPELPVGEQPVDAVLYCVYGDADPIVVPDGVPSVAVLLDDHVLVAGPVGASRQGLAAVHRRVRSLATAEHAARPVADALAGALAAQLLIETLAGVGEPGVAHVVSGAELTTERVVVDPGHEPTGAWHPLASAEVATSPDPDAAVALAAGLTGRWTGRFAPVDAEEDLPQLPLALRELTSASGSVLAWAADQESVTLGVALAALRRSCPGVGAAGTTELQWLLDGALRLLAGSARPAGQVAEDHLGPEGRRIRQSLRRWDSTPVWLGLRTVAGLDWVLGVVESAETGEVLGRAWAPDADRAVRDALGTALARAQLRRDRADDAAVDVLHTDALLDADLAALRAQVVPLALADGVSYRGSSLRVDPVLGELPFWFGPVALAPLDGEEVARWP